MIMCEWCNEREYSIMVGGSGLYCSNKCKSCAEEDKRQRNENENTEKIVYVDRNIYLEQKTEEELEWERVDRQRRIIKENLELEREQSEQEYYEQRAREIKREQDKKDQQIENARLEKIRNQKAAKERDDKKWIFIVVVFLTITTNWAILDHNKSSYDYMSKFLMCNTFYGFYFVYFFCQKRLKFINEWLNKKFE